MSLHYNAFISYKHADLDNKVAATVEKKLERYHIPYKLRKKTGMKKIERIFRDTDELPLTSDLSGTIAEALENADYLIVICSTNTCQSTWVEREIKLFLQNHSQNNILTVLADGEPDDVVPEILKKREITRVNENGETETVIESVEPLSCDFRLPKKDAINIELPRLVGTIDGKEVTAAVGRFGAYVKWDGKFVSLAKGQDPYTIDIEQAKQLIQAKEQAAEKSLIKEFADQEIQVLNGRYGPYIKHKGNNYKIPKGKGAKAAADLTLEDCKALIENAKPKK